MKSSLKIKKVMIGIINVYLIAFLFCLVTSCASKTPQTITKIEYAVPSESLLIPCQRINIHPQTNGELLAAIIDLHAKYRVCSSKMDAIIKYFENVKVLNSEEVEK